MASLDFIIKRFDSIDSTNAEAARQVLLGANEGLCIVAAEQTAGRGRHQRQWLSPKNAGVYFSVILRPRLEQKYWPVTTLAAALAVQEALSESCRLETDIKWPNDILFGGRKLCGILAETVDTQTLVIGIGINLTRDSFPPELGNRATSVEDAVGHHVPIESVLNSLVNKLSSHYETLQEAGGPTKIIGEWTSRSSFAQGKRIRVTDGAEAFVGTTRGLEENGGLCVETDAGEIRVVHAGDVESVRTAE